MSDERMGTGGFEWNVADGTTRSTDRQGIEIINTLLKAHNYIYWRLLEKRMRAAKSDLVDTVSHLGLGIYIGWFLARWLS